jgi:hypothetical protein
LADLCHGKYLEKSSQSIMKTIKYILLLFILLFAAVSLYAQTGAIEGTVRDGKSKESLVGTTVIVVGTTIGTTTDAEGKFKILNLKPGTYNLNITYVSYSPKVIEKVKVESGKTTKVEAVLQENIVALNDVMVTAIRRTNTDVSMISDIKASPFVSIGISSQQISKTLDKDASEVIKRVPGITIQDNRFLIVRGLSQRYNNVWLNNAATPSSEADIRAFSFDVIPSSMIENLMIFKSSAAELPADFSGGFVKISTKNMPDKNSTFFTYSTGFSQGTTFNDFFKYKGSSTDWLGFDNGFRSLPKEMPENLNQYETATNPEVRNRITQLGRELNNTWTASPAVAIPDQKISLGFNRKFIIGKSTLGTTTAFTYGYTNNTDLIAVTDYFPYNFKNDSPSYSDQYSNRYYSSSARGTLMSNWSLLLGKTTKIEFRNILDQGGTSRSTMRTGIEYYSGNHLKANELRYLSRSIYSGQLAGEHSFKEGRSKLEWILGYATSGKKEPDTKRYRYSRDQVDTTVYNLDFPNGAYGTDSQSRMWLNLSEKTESVALNYTQQLDFSGFKPEIKSGFYYENKVRGFKARNFTYNMASSTSTFGQTSLPIDEIFVNDNINLTNGIKLREYTSLNDSYDASNNQIAGYLSVVLPLTSKLSLYTGLRVEKNHQTLSGYYQASTTKAEVDRDTINIFPSVNITYNLNKKNLVRIAYGMSVNRPEFREIAPFYFFDFEMNAGTEGDPRIKQAYIHNFDIRYEMYPTNGETFTVGAFYKKFIDPIEQVIKATTPTRYTYQNVESAYCFGLEAEARKSLDFISALKNFSLVMNASVIRSRVDFSEGSLFRDRSLQGQSPFIVNAALFYQNQKGLTLSLLYNVIGKRISAVGIPSPNEWDDTPDIYEMPRNVLDLTFSKMVGKKLEIKGGIKDILNEKIEFVQTVDTRVDMNSYTNGVESGFKYFKRDQVTRSFRPGSYFTLGISVKF